MLYRMDSASRLPGRGRPATDSGGLSPLRLSAHDDENLHVPEILPDKSESEEIGWAAKSMQAMCLSFTA